MMNAASMQDPDKRRQNVRLALVLASVAAALLIGFVAKVVLLGG
jgi:hypothetical protein